LQGVDVDPEHLTALTGCGSVIDLLLHCVANPGDAVLIPAPYYPAFDNDLKVCRIALLDLFNSPS
jgi:1-aminocyclopropane-1-carboxylate synthase